MARTKEFDRDAVLQKAMHAFREHGYEGTSVQVLVDRMGIHRASLYDTYGSKDQLYKEALGAFEETNQSHYGAVLESTDRARDVIARFFRKCVDDITCTPRADGACLMLKTALSGAWNLEEVPERVQNYFGWYCRQFRDLIARAREEGDVRSDRTDLDLAEHLCQTLLGAVAAASIGWERERVHRNAEHGLSVLYV